jgi:hypothetical protein
LGVLNSLWLEGVIVVGAVPFVRVGGLNIISLRAISVSRVRAYYSAIPRALNMITLVTVILDPVVILSLHDNRIFVRSF